MPLISVIIPSYNHARYIKRAVGSVLQQSITDFEIVVIDDGSGDDSLQVLSTIHDPRLRVFSQPNSGAHHAINRGLGLSSGEYIAILNSDDWFHPLRLEKLLEYIKLNKSSGIVGTYIQVVDENDKPLGVKHGFLNLEPWPLKYEEKSFRRSNDPQKVILTENYLATTSNYFFKRELIEKVGLFRPLRYTHDWDFALKVSKFEKIELLPEVLVSYRVHSSNTIRENKAAMIFEICWCLAVHLPMLLEGEMKSTNDKSTIVERLLSSIYTYEMSEVLNVMLLQQLSINQKDALKLLEPDNSSRKIYLNYINNRFMEQPQSMRSEITPDIEKKIFFFITKVSRRLRLLLKLSKSNE